MSHLETQSFLFEWPADGTSATAPIPLEMANVAYTVTGDIEDIPLGGSAAILVFPSTGRTATTFPIQASGTLLEGTTIALTVVGSQLVEVEAGDIVWGDVVAFAARLADVAIAAQTDILNFVNNHLSPTGFGGEGSYRYRLARIYRAAHEGTLALRAAADAVGGVSGRTEGDLSVTYAAAVTVVGSDPLLDSTEFGKLYRQLVKGTARLRGPLVA